jgi:hypothetical protein
MFRQTTHHSTIIRKGKSEIRITRNEPEKSSVANHILHYMHEKPHIHTITLDNLDRLQEVNKPYQINVYEKYAHTQTNKRWH